MGDIKRKSSEIEIITETEHFGFFLEDLGLPKDNVIAATKDRGVLFQNLPVFIHQLPADVKKDARYLSKFIAATSIGLFDAALNYVWNEVVLNLRKKVVLYGVELFYDAAVGGKNREYYKTETDLDGIKDVVLVDACKKLELISDVVHKKITHILIMRNEVAASHPNVEAIGAFELMGWLETCVKDVLQDNPSESSIQIKHIVDNLKKSSTVFETSTIAAFCENIKFLSVIHINNLLITLFGMYVDADDAALKKNISALAPTIWDLADDKPKFYIGERINSYRVNLHQLKLDNGKEFLKLVDGLRYEELSAKIILLNDLAERLGEAHVGWDNYYHEPPIMEEILLYCKKSGDIPAEVSSQLISAVLRCRIGNGRSYCEGVSPMGSGQYDKFLSILDDTQIIQALIAVFSPEISGRLYNQYCTRHLKHVLSLFKTNAVSERLNTVIDHMAKSSDIYQLHIDKEFRELCKPFF